MLAPTRHESAESSSLSLLHTVWRSLSPPHAPWLCIQNTCISSRRAERLHNPTRIVRCETPTTIESSGVAAIALRLCHGVVLTRAVAQTATPLLYEGAFQPGSRWQSSCGAIDRIARRKTSVCAVWGRTWQAASRIALVLSSTTSQRRHETAIPAAIPSWSARHLLCKVHRAHPVLYNNHPPVVSYSNRSLTLLLSVDPGQRKDGV